MLYWREIRPRSWRQYAVLALRGRIHLIVLVV